MAQIIKESKCRSVLSVGAFTTISVTSGYSTTVTVTLTAKNVVEMIKIDYIENITMFFLTVV